MNATELVRVTTVVAVDPSTAFAIFTDEIGMWWRPKVDLFRKASQGVMRFESGRLIEAYQDGQTFEVGRVLEWEPGKRLRFEWRQADFAPGDVTEVEVRFEPAGAGTRVSLEHRGWDRITTAHPARHGYTGDAFTSMIGLRWADLLTGFRRRAGNSQIAETLHA
jgi:uncharacterized protein YndB with AHSA1/START domain